ncbi:MAG TPA: hypothetical protein VFI30_03645 [Nocardioidaceae bacterium]|nr:hypothetical protein [Nocardioidaceae bacterium]
MKLVNSRTVTVLSACAVLALVGSGAAASGLITSAQIKNGTIRQVDIAPGGVSGHALTGQSEIEAGSVGLRDLSKFTRDHLKTTYVGPNWSIIDRNVIGAADAYLRSGPTAYDSSGTVERPPSGVGSLGIRTADGTSKTEFGDQVDFAGESLSSISHIGYWVYTTNENNAIGPDNMPSIDIEINPNNGSATYSSLVYAPANSAGDAWSRIDAAADTTPDWGLTGSAFSTNPCSINSTRCTWSQIQSLLPNATIYTVGISKGRDYAFSGAVDDLWINNTTYNFEPFGVFQTTS